MRAAVLALALAAAAPADAACRLALSLGLDVSGSVDAEEYALQMRGLAGALENPDVQTAIFALPGARVRLQVFLWAGQNSRMQVLDWVELAGPEDLARAAATIRSTGRGVMGSTTALGLAMLAGGRALGAQAACWRRVLDLSGDGQSNDGPRPRDVRGDPLLNGITINALVIGPGLSGEPSRRPDTTIADLPEYFRIEVIQGPDAFVETADGFADYQAAMTRKLLRELQVLAVTEAGSTARPRP